MNRMCFRKASSICLAVTMACLQVHPLTALPVFAEEDTILDEEFQEVENSTELVDDETSDVETFDEESETTEAVEEEEVADIEDLADETASETESEADDEIDSEEEISGETEADEMEFETAAAVKVLSGSISSKLSQLQKQYPAGRYWNHQVAAGHKGDKQFTAYDDLCNNPEETTNHPCDTHSISSSSSTTPHTGDYSCNYFDNGIQCNGYARTLFYKLHGKRASTLAIKRPTSISEISVGDFVHISSSSTNNHALIVTSINKSKNTITGTDANNGESCKISWNSTFKFSEVDYVISPNNATAGIAPDDNENTSLFIHNPKNTKTYILSFDTSGENTQASLNNVTCYYNDYIYLPSNIVTNPGYKINGWKIKLPSGQYLKVAGYKDDGEKYGIGTAAETIKYRYSYDRDGNIIFRPGNAFWAEEGPKGGTFTLVPQWIVDPDYQAPVEPSQPANPSTPSTPTQPADPANPFDDVKKGDWYYDWVVKSNEAGLMTGLNSTHFGPNDKMSRAMVATVLYRMAGSPNISDTQIFPDVPAGQWYSKAIKWANEKKVATGYENGKFGPDDNITREQLATMICRYQRNVAGKSTSDKASLDKFPDKKNVNDFARESVQYCVAKGIITGSHGHLLPVDNATRAECAKMLLVAKDAK